MGGHQGIPGTVQNRVAEARAALTAAEAQLETAIRAVETAERAEKRIISDGLHAAFDKVSIARKVLDDLLRDA